jgi:hypothetical protein
MKLYIVLYMFSSAFATRRSACELVVRLYAYNSGTVERKLYIGEF